MLLPAGASGPSLPMRDFVNKKFLDNAGLVECATFVNRAMERVLQAVPVLGRLLGFRQTIADPTIPTPGHTAP